MIAVLGMYLYFVYMPNFFFFPIGLDKHVFPQNGLGVELCPIIPIFEQIKHVDISIVAYQVFGNLVCLAPATFLAAVAYPRFRSYPYSLLLGVGISGAIEAIQLLINYITQITNRAVDVNDFILNSIGSCLGYLAYKLLNNIFVLDSTIDTTEQ